ncbi:hypothetical protein D3C71_1164150 [compost metagenome]
MATKMKCPSRFSFGNPMIFLNWNLLVYLYVMDVYLMLEPELAAIACIYKKKVLK